MIGQADRKRGVYIIHQQKLAISNAVTHIIWEALMLD